MFGSPIVREALTLQPPDDYSPSQVTWPEVVLIDREVIRGVQPRKRFFAARKITPGVGIPLERG